MNKRKIIRRFLSIIAGLIVLLLLLQLGLHYRPEINLLLHPTSSTQKVLISKLHSHGYEDVLFLFLLNTICVAVPGLSNGIFCVLTGILYGPTLGFCINWISDICGQFAVLFIFVRIYSRRQVTQSRLYRLLTLQSHPQLACTLGYAIPFIPSVTVSMANAIVNKQKSERLRPIILGTAPFAFLYAYGGDSILHLNGERLIWTIGILLVIAAIALFMLLHDYRKNKADA